MSDSIPNSIHNSFHDGDIDPTALGRQAEHPSFIRSSVSGEQEARCSDLRVPHKFMPTRAPLSRGGVNCQEVRPYLPYNREGVKKAPRRGMDLGEKATSPNAYHPCDYKKWDIDLPPVDMTSSVYKKTLEKIHRNFPRWQREVVLSGEILLHKIKTREQRLALIEVAKHFGFNPSSPRATTCKFVYIKHTNQVFMRATGQKLPFLDEEIARSLQRLEERHQAYLICRQQQEEGAPNRRKGSPCDEVVGMCTHHVPSSNAGFVKATDRRHTNETQDNNFQEAPLPAARLQPYILRWWFVDRYAHRDVLELLRLLACEIGVFRGEPTLSFEQLQLYDQEAAASLENPISFRVEIALEYQPRWEKELKLLLSEEPGSIRDPYPISYIRRDRFAMKQYQQYLRPFFYDWRPIVTRCFVDLVQGRDFPPGAPPSNITAMGTAFFLRHEIDVRGQVFYRRWVRHSLELFAEFGVALRKQDAENVRQTFLQLRRNHAQPAARGTNHVSVSPNKKALLELLEQAKKETPHFGTLNLCIELHFFKKDLSEIQKFSARYGYFVYIRRDEGMIYVAATARDVPVLPCQRFDLFFLPNGGYVGPVAFRTFVDTRMGAVGEAPPAVPPSLLSLLEDELQSDQKTLSRVKERREAQSWSSASSFSSDSSASEKAHVQRPRSVGKTHSLEKCSSSSSNSTNTYSSNGSQTTNARAHSASHTGMASSDSSLLGRSREASEKRYGKHHPPDLSFPLPRYVYVPTLPASSLYDAIVGPNQRLNHNPGCTVESHLVKWAEEEKDGQSSCPPRVLHFALNHFKRQAHIIGG